MEKAPFTQDDISKCREFFENIKELVKKELSHDVSIVKTPKVADDIQEEYAGLAEKLVDIQLEKGSIYPKDLTDAELMRLKRLAKKNGISTTEVVSSLVENGNYVGKNRADAIALAQVIEDIKNIAEMPENIEKVITVSLLSKGSKDFLVNKRFNLPMKMIVENIVSVYMPGYENYRISSGESRPKITDNKKKYLKTLQQFEEILATEFADKVGNIDKIFMAENKELLKELIFALNNSNISFDKFIKMTGMKYTKIYRVNPTPAVKQMLAVYHKYNGSFENISEKDPFLRSKIEAAEERENIYSLAELLNKFGFSHNIPKKAQKLSEVELTEREKKLVIELKTEFPNNEVPEKLYKSHEKLSDEIVFMAKRRGFDYSEDYLKTLGFERNSKQKIKLSERQTYLTENDLLRYLFTDEKGLQNFENELSNYDGELADVETNRSTYSRLLFDKKYENSHLIDYRKKKQKYEFE